MNKSEEQRLLQLARTLEPEALAAIYDRYSPGLYAYAMRLMGDVQNAEDCVSDTFSRFLKSLGQKAGPREHLQAYLYRIAHNWITDHYRRTSQPEVELDDRIPSSRNAVPEDVFDYRNHSQQLRDAIFQLTEEQRQVIMLRYLEEWDYKEIAASLNRSVGAIKALQHRGLENLQKIINKLN
jgi:RNA polymerase sigma-70 factor (ECF subfamily)